MESQEFSCFFLMGCARSGTTSLCSILDKASNGVCLLEPSPQLHKECRLYWEGSLKNPEECLQKVLEPRIRKASVPVYGEKNVTLGVFAGLLAKLFPCKLVYITRDGRDCVQSMRNWHQYMFGNLYREGKAQPPLCPRAQAVIDALPVADDLSDYGRPRPLPSDPWYERWDSMSHHQMLCWYWNAWNMRILDELEQVPHTQWRRIDYSAATLQTDIKELIDFLGLEGIDDVFIATSLEQHINSCQQRTGEALPVTTWRNWTDQELDQFWEICTPAMQRLGYYTPSLPEERRWTPDYGQWWMSQEVSHDFFASIYADRLYQHEAFYAWARPLLESGTICSVLEIGCGHGIGYSDFFADIAYTGLDISEKEIVWCQQHYAERHQHRWLQSDFVRQGLDETFDLVFCQGTIENMYDMDALLRRMAGCARRYIHLTGFYGFHDEIEQHQYVWNETYKSYSNLFSIKQALHVLESCGFRVLEVSKVPTRKESNPWESRIIAERSD